LKAAEKEEHKEDGNKGEATTMDKEEEADVNKAKKIKRLKHVPQPHEYGSIVDYLEAKYVQGVMVDDEGGDENDEEDDDEGQGSVYSQDSFFDDTDLQRTVAEQVLAHSTTTKLELQDDDQFFVNVGNLEVEETDMTQEQYDPLEDTNEKSAPKRKRKKPSAPSDKTTKTVNGGTNKKPKTSSTATAGSKPSAAVSSPGKKAKPAVPKEENETKPISNTKKPSAAGSSADLEKLKQVSTKRKRRMDKHYKQLMAMISTSTSEELPRKKTKERVAITCPPDKKPGDQIMFANPHVPGQRLKVKIPKNATPGSTFKVTVPVADLAADDETDYNKFSREFYDTLDDYARAYDNWCDAEQDYRKASGDKEFAGHLEKRKKFDVLISEFPKDLKTVVDKPYIQKILRRARQNKHKRERTMAKQAAIANGESDSDDESDEEEEKEEVKPKQAKPAAAAAVEKKVSPVKKPKAVVSMSSISKAQPKAANASATSAAPVTTTIVIPQLSKVFTTKVFSADDF
jgi:hypothetical protein